MLRELLLLLAVAGWAQGRTLTQAGGDVSDRPGRGPPQLRGTLVTVTDAEAGEDDWALIDANGKILPLKKGVKPRDRGGRPIPSGSVVDLTCPSVDASGQCTYFQSPTDATVISPAPGPSPTAKTESVLIMILDYSACKKGAETTVTAVTQQFFNAPAGSVSYADRFEQCSYSSLKLAPPGNTAGSSRIVLLRPRPCPSTIQQNTCDFWAMASNADSNAQAAGINPSAYTRKLYLLPSSLMSNTPGVGCYNWAARATIGSNLQWYFTYSYGSNRWATVMQEYIHNYGCSSIEYEDYSTSMGRGDSCPNAAEISALKWARPAVSVSSPTGPVAGVSGFDLNQVSLPLGKALLFNMPATYMTGAGNYIRVTPNWLGAAYTLNLYMALRVGKNADAGMGASKYGLSYYSQKINIHTVDAAIDNDQMLNGGSMTGDRKISFVTALAPSTRSTVLATPYKLVVMAGTWTRTNADGSSASDILRLYVCRFAVSEAECPTLADVEPASWPPSPQPPSPPSPPPQPLPPSPSPPENPLAP
ncbi:hypothetical protein HXX76_005581 [Chlamydomonas incerta]|uniref:Peptidase M11 gametolysin domain-containing protein n=1 Tax=Chlamydomonas incerta TaxID=51695 RepID=A0A835W727_CHLIN|nr:hypothetical protein HXX76_005581 [Chlamydomonas incerta]|eukprot:KAG2437966.1 hypothetical protein HXX76_005581 [Chlamydomonas incerta]